MASLTVSSSILASASSLVGTRVAAPSHHAAVSVKMAPVRCQAKTDAEVLQRRAVMAAAVASVLTLASPALAFESYYEGLKKGSKEAKKKYANICVSQTQAYICHG